MLGLDAQGSPQTYIIAQNPAVLAQLMRENENRTMNPSAYTTPASVFNTLAVDIDSDRTEPTSEDAPILPLKTVILPASELLKLDPIVQSQMKQQYIFEGEDMNASSKSNTLDRYNLPNDFILNQDLVEQSLSPTFPAPCEVISALTQKMQSLDSNAIDSTELGQDLELQENAQALQNVHPAAMNNSFQYSKSFHPNQFTPPSHYKMVQASGLPPHSEMSQKSRSLERNTPPLVAHSARMSSMERMQDAAKQSRSNSLTRQFACAPVGSASFNPGYPMAVRSASLERSASMAAYSCRTKSLERANQQQQPQPQQISHQHPEMAHVGDSQRGGSLERNQSAASAYEMLKLRGFRSGSLERNHQSGMQYQMYRDQFKQSTMAHTDSAPLQEEIYDFGGANVKSCASIALNKSISRGLIPAGTALPLHTQSPQPQQCVPINENGAGQSLQQASASALPPTATKVNGPTYATHGYAQPAKHQMYGQNATYTPMYPRMWSESQQQLPTQQPQHNIAMSHVVYMQQSPKFVQNTASKSSNYFSHQINQTNSQIASSQLVAQPAQTAEPINIPNAVVDACGAAVQVCWNPLITLPAVFVSSMYFIDSLFFLLDFISRTYLSFWMFPFVVVVILFYCSTFISKYDSVIGMFVCIFFFQK